MPSLQLPPNPPRNQDEASGGEPDLAQNDRGRIAPMKLRTNRFGELEEHELIHLIDALDDERSRARFRESIYISVLVWIAIAWFLIYGPRVLFHQPVLKDPFASLKQHDKDQLTYLNTPPAPPAKPPVLNQKTIQRIQKQAQPAPQPPAPQPLLPAAPVPEVAHNIAPPVSQPPLPLPSAPRPAPSAELPSAPHANVASNAQPSQSSLLNSMRNALNGRGGAEIASPRSSGPLQAGAQILSDTGDWDPSAYMRKLQSDIQRNWDPLIPEEVQAPLMKKGIVGIRFIILRDGQIGDIKLETTSGDVALDKAAWYGITSEGQFPQLPKEYHGQQLELRVGFFYNEQMHQ